MSNPIKSFFSTSNSINEHTVFAVVVLAYILIMRAAERISDPIELGVWLGIFTGLCGIGTSRANAANKIVSKLSGGGK